ncbi:hypothetical protein HDZ31DRAFT_50515, partial [Schizophyllum fasciatum]
AWAVGNAVGPQVFRDDDKPRYIRAFIAHMVVYALQIVILVFLRMYLMRMNVLKRRAAALKETAANGETPVRSNSFVLLRGRRWLMELWQEEQLGHSHAFDDLTDKENPDFRYTY